MRLGILTDGKIALWQRRAVERACRGHDIYLIVSTAGRKSTRRTKHALYYALNLFTVRNRLTRKVELPAADVSIIETIEFEPTFEGPWAVLSDELLAWIDARGLDAVVKLGLGLLRVPPSDQLSIPILSYHHGDPTKYRGRPAGFYELLRGEAFMGQIVQAIGPKLDGGTVYAFSETRVHPYSYRRTLIDAYSLSPYLLEQALENVRLKRPLDMEPSGPNYRLPGNLMVARFIAARAWALIRRICYGLLFEKQWRVATAKSENVSDPTSALSEIVAKPWHTPPIAQPFRFYADPFFGKAANEIYVEALNGLSGKGEIVRITDGREQRISGFDGHVSYPASIEENGRWFLVPETTSWCRLTAFEIDRSQARRFAEIDIDESAITDPTLLAHGGYFYLFANVKAEGPSILHLWLADSLTARFVRHPRSPIRVSSRGSRMAGEVGEWNGRLYRLGQLWEHSYGDGVVAFRITALSPTEYAEECIGKARFDHVRGPHTVNRRGDLLLFDYYRDRFSPLGGVRRLLNRL